MMRAAVRSVAPRCRMVSSGVSLARGVNSATHLTGTAAFAGGCVYFQHRSAATKYVQNLMTPIGYTPTRETKTESELREELPTIFDKRPEEIDDYIRPERTYFERLEDLWDWFIGFLSPVEKQMSWMRGLHEGALGFELSWGLVFFVWGCLMRIISLGPMLYSQRNTLRMSRCTVKTTEIQNNIKRVKGDKTLTTPEKRVMQDGYKRMEAAIYKQNKCHKYGSLVGGIASPFMVSAFMAIRRLAAYEDDLESANFLWITDLTMPDPTMILPFICGGIFMFNFEMNQRLNRGGRSSVGMYMRWGVRGISLVATWYFSSQPACLFTYWIGMSSVGLLQPVLLRNQKFRDYFDFPDPPKVAQQHAETAVTTGKWNWLPKFMRPVTTEELQPKPQSTLNKKVIENINDQELVLDDDVDADSSKSATTATSAKAK